MPNFLSPLLKATSPDGFRLVHADSGQVVADRLSTAFDSASRKRGLLKHRSLPADTAMIIAPCSAVHTVGMSFPIDVIFVRRDGTVLKVSRRMKPWRLAAGWGSFAVIEMAAGAAAATVADRLAVVLAP